MIQPPSADELRAIARDHGLELSDADLELYRNLMVGTLGALGAIDAAPSGLPDVPAGRDWWEPSAAENPHNGWYVRCEIRTREDGPLAGLRFAAKDNVMVAGLPLLNGSPVLEGYVAEVDATIVTRLLDAGATLAGKAHCENFCLSGGSHTNTRGLVHNPRRRGHSAGGSSSGSAAVVAAGDVELAIGGDQGGSIRIPAALCGVVGMKPTWGLVPYTGIAPLDPSIDHAGPITANVRDNARMLAAIAGPDGIDMRQSGARAVDYERTLADGVDGLRIALVSEGFTAPGMQPAVASAVRAAAERFAKLGARVDEISIPEHAQANALCYPLLVQGMYRTVLCGGGQGSGRPDVYLPGFYDRMAKLARARAGLPAAAQADGALGGIPRAPRRRPLLPARREPGAPRARRLRPRARARRRAAHADVAGGRAAAAGPGRVVRGAVRARVGDLSEHDAVRRHPPSRDQRAVRRRRRAAGGPDAGRAPLRRGDALPHCLRVRAVIEIARPARSAAASRTRSPDSQPASPSGTRAWRRRRARESPPRAADRGTAPRSARSGCPSGSG